MAGGYPTAYRGGRSGGGTAFKSAPAQTTAPSEWADWIKAQDDLNRFLGMERSAASAKAWRDRNFASNRERKDFGRKKPSWQERRDRNTAAATFTAALGLAYDFSVLSDLERLKDWILDKPGYAPGRAPGGWVWCHGPNEACFSDGAIPPHWSWISDVYFGPAAGCLQPSGNGCLGGQWPNSSMAPGENNAGLYRDYLVPVAGGLQFAMYGGCIDKVDPAAGPAPSAPLEKEVISTARPQPFVEPSLQPHAVPNPEPLPPPYWRIPYRPDGEAGRETGPKPERLTDQQSVPFVSPGVRRVVETTITPAAVETQTRSEGGYVGAPPRVRFARNTDRSRKEKKVRMAAHVSVGHILGAVTEASDLVDSLFMALPKEVRVEVYRESGKRFSNNRGDGQALTMFEKAKAIGDNWEVLDAALAVENWVKNQIEDFIIGKIGAAGKGASQRVRPHGDLPLGFSFGPAL